MFKRYYCPHCDGLISESSVCPVCGNRTKLIENTVYWSKAHHCPIIGNPGDTNPDLKRIGTSVRPVFPQERRLIRMVLNESEDFEKEILWAVNNSVYVINGKRKKIDFKDAYHEEHIIRQIREAILYSDTDWEKEEEHYLSSDQIQNFITFNQDYLNELVSEAVDYVKRITQDKGLDEIYISFSGGKDSSVTSDLVMRALGTQQVIHFFGDTTLEYPETTKYVKKFRSEHPNTPFLVAKNNEQDFMSLCETIGPPSRVLRWCCTVFKTGAISQKIESIFKNKNQIISFQGIRRNESKSRSKYERETLSPKIAKQTAASPIIDWFDSDIWLYILSNHLEINPAYKKGFTRVGCWCCPNNSEWSEFLSTIYMKQESGEFRQFLYDFSRKIGKPDWKQYVDTGKWKARQGGNGVSANSNIVVAYEPCALEENTYNFQLNRDISDRLYTLFKPFGTLDFSLGKKRLDEVYILDRKSGAPLLRLSGKKGTRNLKVTILGKHPAFKNKKITESLIRAQITKFQSCLACSGCQSACKFGALKVMNLDKENVDRENVLYTIDTDKCVGCMECVSHYDSGCYMYKVLKVRIDKS